MSHRSHSGQTSSDNSSSNPSEDFTATRAEPGTAGWVSAWALAWNKFWFTPTLAHTLAAVRIMTGALVFYTILVWTFDFSAFIGGGLISPQYRQLLYQTPLESMMAWSHFDWVEPSLHLPMHMIGLIVVGLFTVGWQTRITGTLTALLVISYSNRTVGALFGLDQILAFLTLYLALSRSGDAYSVDRWRANAPGANAPGQPSILNTIATRLIQLHLCIVYLFAGLGKCQGEKWWDGEAVWGTFASHEYQTLDMLWMSDHMWLIAILTMATLFWEVSYAALIWPKLTRPIVLLLAIPMHLSIGLCLGMLEFGLVMLVANIAFISPNFFRRTFRWHR